jgi:hypothetical protein
LAAAYHASGDRERAAEWAQKLMVRHRASYGAALYFANTGGGDAMFEALEEAYRQRDVYLLTIRSVPNFEPYRADPRFEALLRKMKLV